MSGPCAPALGGAARHRSRWRGPRRVLAALVATALLLSIGTAARADVLVPGPAGLVISRETSECVTVKDALPYHGADVRVGPCRGGVNQIWRVESLGNDYYWIRVLHTGMCLDVYGRNWADGTNVVQGVCQDPTLSTSWNQQWKAVKVDGVYQLRPRHASGMCLDKYWGDVVIWTCQVGKPWEQWVFL
jgi:hypothetical protein